MEKLTRVGWLVKYVARHVRNNEDEEEWYDYYPAPHVPYVDESSLQPTGLVDALGVPLWRVPNPIGFGRKLEW